MIPERTIIVLAKIIDNIDLFNGRNNRLDIVVPIYIDNPPISGMGSLWTLLLSFGISTTPIFHANFSTKGVVIKTKKAAIQKEIMDLSILTPSHNSYLSIWIIHYLYKLIFRVKKRE